MRDEVQDFVEDVGQAVARGYLDAGLDSSWFSLYVGITVPAVGAASFAPSSTIMRNILVSRLASVMGKDAGEVVVDICEHSCQLPKPTAR